MLEKVAVAASAAGVAAGSLDGGRTRSAFAKALDWYLPCQPYSLCLCQGTRLVSAMPAVLALPLPRHSTGIFHASRTRSAFAEALANTTVSLRPGLLGRLPRESPEVTEHEFPVACLRQGVRGPLPFCLRQGSRTRNRRICSVPHSLANVAESPVCCYGLSLSRPISLSLSPPLPRLSPLDRAAGETHQQKERSESPISRTNIQHNTILPLLLPAFSHFISFQPFSLPNEPHKKQTQKQKALPLARPSRCPAPQSSA